MGRLIISNQITVDGVMEAPSPDGWFNPDGEHEAWGSVDQIRAADAFLLGRKTYAGLASVWPNIPGEFADRVNSLPKYVASRTLEEPLEWNATLLKGDLAEQVSSLKERHAGNLLTFGAGELAYWLTTHRLADEIRFWVHPYVWGSGDRIFLRPQPVPLELVSTTTYRSGVTLMSYRPAPS
jgi:dihydrofolate reductase